MTPSPSDGHEFNIDLDILNQIGKNPGQSKTQIILMIYLEKDWPPSPYIGTRIDQMIQAGAVEVIASTSPPYSPGLYLSKEELIALSDEVVAVEDEKNFGQHWHPVPCPSTRTKPTLTWSRPQLQYIKRWYGIKSYDEIGEALGKTGKCIQHKVSKMIREGQLSRKVPGYVYVQKAAQILGVNPDRVYSWQQAGDLEAIRRKWKGSGGSILFKRTVLEEFKTSPVYQTHMARVSSKPDPVVQTRASDLISNTTWSSEDIQFLKDNLDLLSPTQLAFHLKRTVRGVEGQIARTRNPGEDTTDKSHWARKGYISTLEAAQILGIPKNQVLVYFHEGFLKGIQPRGPKGSCYFLKSDVEGKWGSSPASLPVEVIHQDLPVERINFPEGDDLVQRLQSLQDQIQIAETVLAGLREEGHLTERVVLIEEAEELRPSERVDSIQIELDVPWSAPPIEFTECEPVIVEPDLPRTEVQELLGLPVEVKGGWGRFKQAVSDRIRGVIP